MSSIKRCLGKNNSKKVLALGVAAALPMVGTVQAEGVSQLEEIVITAQKRETNLQTTAMAISAISGTQLKDQQIMDVEGLSGSLPNVNFGQTTGNARIAIRGVGFDNITLGNEGRIAYHVDGIYISRPAAAMATFFDVERVEVLRGPQGTLYGRNATGGAVNVITKTPSEELEGYLKVAVGNYNLLSTEGAVGEALSETVSARGSFQTVERDGYGENLTTGKDVDDQSSQAARVQLRFDPSDNLDITLAADYFSQDDHAFGLHYLGAGSLPDANTTPALTGATPSGLLAGGTVPSDLRDSTADIGPFNDRESWGASTVVNTRLGEVDLTSITAFRHSEFHAVTDLDGTSAELSVYDQEEDSDQWSQEIRLSGVFSQGEWMVGVYYLQEDFFGGTRIALVTPGTFGPLRRGYFGMGGIDTEAYAVFASLKYDLSEQLALRIGVRYSEETKEIEEGRAIDFATPYPPLWSVFPGPTRTDDETWSSTTPSVTLEYQANDEVFMYATYSEGFKSGGYNLGGIQEPFAPEELADFEFGIRADLMEGKLRTNVSAFYYDYTDLQVSKVNGAVITVENAATATVQGVEVEITAVPTDRLLVDLSLALLDAEYDDFTSGDPARAALGELDLSGNKLTQAPEYTANLGVTYTVPSTVGDFDLRGEARLVDGSHLTPFGLDHTYQDSYELYNAFVTWTGIEETWSATAYVRNIGDEEVVSAEFVGTGLVGFPLVGSLLPPRTYGVSVTYSF